MAFFSRGDTFDRRGAGDCVDFPLLDGMALWLWNLRGSLHLGLRGLPGVKDKSLEIALIHQFLELSLERMTVHCMMAHTVVESMILPGSWSLRIGRE